MGLRGGTRVVVGWVSGALPRAGDWLEIVGRTRGAPVQEVGPTLGDRLLPARRAGPRRSGWVCVVSG